jgi:hypothetical protein
MTKHPESGLPGVAKDTPPLAILAVPCEPPVIGHASSASRKPRARSGSSAAAPSAWNGALSAVKAALRKLARERPGVPEALLRDLFVGVLDPTATLELAAEDALNDRRADPHSAVDPDVLARVGCDQLLHLEFQDYPDTGFVDRLFRQHLTLVLRYPELLVTTVAFWVARPRHPHRLEVIRRGRLMVPLVSGVLPELSASRMLAQEETACFAAGADAEGWTDEELCELVAAALKRSSASASAREAAAALAATRGRYEIIIRALSR